MWIEMCFAPKGMPKIGASDAHLRLFRTSYISPRNTIAQVLNADVSEPEMDLLCDPSW
jgi:hypothetical protein